MQKKDRSSQRNLWYALKTTYWIFILLFFKAQLWNRGASCIFLSSKYTSLGIRHLKAAGNVIYASCPHIYLCIQSSSGMNEMAAGVWNRQLISRHWRFVASLLIKSHHMPVDPILKMSLRSLRHFFCLLWCDVFMRYHGYSFDRDSVILKTACWRCCIPARRVGILISAQNKKKIWGYLFTIKNN